MPQIRCPNCGLTISLENRKETDEGIITNAVQGKERTFTDLLHITRLPRKTLSIRLKGMCENGLIAKEDGFYKSNGFSTPGSSLGFQKHRLSVMIRDKRIRAGLMMVALVISVPAFSYAMAGFVAPLSFNEPVVIGDFEMILEVHNVDHLAAWQVYIAYDTSELKVLSVKSGGFLDNNNELFISRVDVDGDGAPSGTLLLADSSYSDTLPKNGGGVLATIVFGYYVSTYTEPTIVSDWQSFESGWIDSRSSPTLPEESAIIPFEVPSTLTMMKVE
jgi:hypothetical protein